MIMFYVPVTFLTDREKYIIEVKIYLASVWFRDVGENEVLAFIEGKLMKSLLITNSPHTNFKLSILKIADAPYKLPHLILGKWGLERDK